jgi:hypothetical protein
MGEGLISAGVTSTAKPGNAIAIEIKAAGVSVSHLVVNNTFTIAILIITLGNIAVSV